MALEPTTETPPPGQTPPPESTIVDDEPELAPVDVDLTAEEAEKAGIKPTVPAPAADLDSEAPEGEPKKRRTGNLRIQQLTKEKHDALRYAEQLKAENEALKKRTQASDSVAVAQYEAATRAKLEEAKRLQVDAIERGDAIAQANINVDVARLASELGQVDAWKQGQPKPAAEPTPAPAAPAPQRQQDDEPPPDIAAWMDKNPWFDYRRPDDFDQEMVGEAAAFANLLDRQYKRAGRSAQIRGDAYYKSIDDHMRKEFPDYAWPAATPPRGQAPQMRSGGPVAPPATGAAPSGSPSGGSSTRITLTAEQRAFARKLPLKHPNGSPFSDAQKEREYAIQLASLSSEGA